ncbi:hypothetical protein QBC35DRAFT_461086 [Podospora australis]|uniref:T6SS Phospholipase effector Tle1-like catalytic domain-containing protein n=1 Tax=Podospora australis TaxID=1536484 RepID=A0AAN6WY63_9PEZI|nr:hypothetical protein QBC35DRAFT_461086 [Podospora australis]
MAARPSILVTKKRLINPVGKKVVPSNVTRLSRSLRRNCTDGTLQIIKYHSGVGTGGSFTDIFSGGAVGLGISEDIRSAYSFICANYADGDEIILLGFSRGAFTARSEDPFPDAPFAETPKGVTAAEEYRKLLAEKGLTRIHDDDRKIIKVRAVAVWDTVGSLGIPSVSLSAQFGLPNHTKELRFYDTNLSNRIEYAFQALALDEHRPPFPPALWERATVEARETDLRQVWFPGNHGNCGGGWDDAGIANLSLAWMMDQLASIGVGFDEETIMRIFSETKKHYLELAEQDEKLQAELAATKEKTLDEIAAGNDDEVGGCCSSILARFSSVLPVKINRWAMQPIYRNNNPIRPWGLGQIQGLQGLGTRSPGTYKRLDPVTGSETNLFLEGTNERIHSSVRIRLAVEGLGLNDRGIWKAPALKGAWRLRTVSTMAFHDPIPSTIETWEPTGQAQASTAENTGGLVEKAAETIVAKDSDTTASEAQTMVDLAAEQQRPLNIPKGSEAQTLVDVAAAQQHPLNIPKGRRWVYEYCGSKKDAPPIKLMVEEPLGPFERQLLRLSGGIPNVYEFAEARNKMDGKIVGKK